MNRSVITRRAALAGVGAALLLGLSGCLGACEDDDDDDDGDSRSKKKKKRR